VVDRGSNRKVSKNHIGGVKVSRIALSVVDRGTNRKVSNNHIGGVKVSRIALSVVVRGSNKGNNKITELRTILQRESQNS
jgi:hypothetical protein